MTSDDQLDNNTGTVSGAGFAWRLGWIAVRLVLVYALATEFQPFFYQAF